MVLGVGLRRPALESRSADITCRLFDSDALPWQRWIRELNFITCNKEEIQDDE